MAITAAKGETSRSRWITWIPSCSGMNMSTSAKSIPRRSMPRNRLSTATSTT
jgi:hypothetical protein